MRWLYQTSVALYVYSADYTFCVCLLVCTCVGLPFVMRMLPRVAKIMRKSPSIFTHYKFRFFPSRWGFFSSSTYGIVLDLWKYIVNCYRNGNIQLSWNKKSCMCFRLVYLYLNLTHHICQDYWCFDCKELAKSDRLGNRFYCQQIRNPIWALH